MWVLYECKIILWFCQDGKNKKKLVLTFIHSHKCICRTYFDKLRCNRLEVDIFRRYLDTSMIIESMTWLPLNINCSMFKSQNTEWCQWCILYLSVDLHLYNQYYYIHTIKQLCQFVYISMKMLSIYINTNLVQSS